MVPHLYNLVRIQGKDLYNLLATLALLGELQTPGKTISRG